MSYNKSESDSEKHKRYVGWFHDLDAWTEYWDIYHPETNGRFYFGDEKKEKGLLSLFLPREQRPLIFDAWINMALYTDKHDFVNELSDSEVANAIMEIDALLDRLFLKHFGNASELAVQEDYLNAMFLFASNSLPPATERDNLISATDPRKPTAGRHTLEGDIMWFAWSLQVEAAHEITKIDKQNARRRLFLAGIALGCPVNFAWKGHRRTRPEYTKSSETQKLLMERGIKWINNFEEASNEIHALYRIREWGSEE
jgi:hypothetical protein